MDAGEVALTLGGTALFGTGHALFKRGVFGELPWPHLVAILLLAALVPLGFASPALSAAAALILVGLAVCETVTRQVASPGRTGRFLSAHHATANTPYRFGVR